MANIPILPGDDFVNTARKITVNWVKWLIALATYIYASPSVVGVVEESNLTASLGVTPIPTALLVSGRYRITATARVTTPAGTSSALQAHVHATQGGVSVQADGNNTTDNTTSANSTISAIYNVTANTALGFSVDYTSVGVPVMAYEVFAVAELIP